jgi:hypothetical protein
MGSGAHRRAPGLGVRASRRRDHRAADTTSTASRHGAGRRGRNGLVAHPSPGGRRAYTLSCPRVRPAPVCRSGCGHHARRRLRRRSVISCALRTSASTRSSIRSISKGRPTLVTSTHMGATTSIARKTRADPGPVHGRPRKRLRFVVAPDHVDGAVDCLVERTGSFAVVKKTALAEAGALHESTLKASRQPSSASRENNSSRRIVA